MTIPDLELNDGHRIPAIGFGTWPMTGQEAVNVAQTFHDRLNVTGLILTKMDGTAKGGIAVAIQAELGIPVVSRPCELGILPSLFVLVDPHTVQDIGEDAIASQYASRDTEMVAHTRTRHTPAGPE